MVLCMRNSITHITRCSEVSYNPSIVRFLFAYGPSITAPPNTILIFNPVIGWLLLLQVQSALGNYYSSYFYNPVRFLILSSYGFSSQSSHFLAFLILCTYSFNKLLLILCPGMHDIFLLMGMQSIVCITS